MEPERPIEKLLRAVAKKRREQAGEAVELKGAARQRLHQEISRGVTGKSGGTFLASLFSGFHPRLAFALGFVVIVLVGGWFLMPVLTGRKPATLASADIRLGKVSPAMQDQPMIAPAPVVASAPALAEDHTKKTFDETSSTLSHAAPMQPAQPSAVGGNRQRTVAESDTFKAAGEFQSDDIQTNSPAVMPAAPPPVETMTAASAPPEQPAGSLAKADRLTVDGITASRPTVAPQIVGTGSATSPATIAAAEPETLKKLPMQNAPISSTTGSAALDYGVAKDEAFAVAAVASQRFNRTEAPGAQLRGAGVLSIPARVLASFKVEQNGQQMRIVDADGSVYTGVLQLAQDESDSHAAVVGRLQNSPSATRAAKAFAPPPPIQNYFFRVAGTNHNLKQNVVFSGNLIPLTNALFAGSNAAVFGGGAGGGGGGNARPTVQPPPAASPLLNARISGKVVIGDRREIEVNAVPAP